MTFYIKKHYAVIILLCCFPLLSVAQNIILDDYVQGEGLNFSEKNGGYKMKLQGYVQTMLESRTYDGDEAFYHRFRARRMRLRLAGEAPKQKISYRFQVDLSGTGEADEVLNGGLLDAWIAYHPNKDWQVIFGQRATRTDNRELMMASHTLQLVERSRLTSAFASIREFGIYIEGKQKIGDQFYIKPMLSITDGDGSNAIGKNYGGLKYGGRVNFLPFGLMTFFGEFRQGDMMREFTPKLSIGLTYNVNQGMSSRRGREGGAILYLNDQNEQSLPDYTKFGADFLFKYKGFSALGEYMKTTASVPVDITQRVRNDGSVSSTFVGGVDAYVRGRMMLGEGYNFQMGYIFRSLYSVDARYTHLIPDENSFLNNTLFYNRNNHYTIGLTKYLTKNYSTKFQFSATYIDAGLGSRKVNGDTFIGAEWVGQFLVQVAF